MTHGRCRRRRRGRGGRGHHRRGCQLPGPRHARVGDRRRGEDLRPVVDAGHADKSAFGPTAFDERQRDIGPAGADVQHGQGRSGASASTADAVRRMPPSRRLNRARSRRFPTRARRSSSGPSSNSTAPKVGPSAQTADARRDRRHRRGPDRPAGAPGRPHRGDRRRGTVQYSPHDRPARAAGRIRRPPVDRRVRASATPSARERRGRSRAHRRDRRPDDARRRRIGCDGRRELPVLPRRHLGPGSRHGCGRGDRAPRGAPHRDYSDSCWSRSGRRSRRSSAGCLRRPS